MDTPIIIDDDFTIDVVEAEDEEFGNVNNFTITNDPDKENNTEFLNNSVTIKEEFEIDFEDNYLIANAYVNFIDIKTEINEIETEDEELKQETSSVQEQPEAQIQDVTVPSDGIPEKSSNTSSDLSLDKESISDIESTEVTSKAEKQSIHKAPIQHQNRPQLIKKMAPNASSNHPRALLDKRKISVNMRKSTPQTTKTLKNHERRYDKNLMPFRFRNQHKLSPPRFHRNYGRNYDSLVTKSFFAKKSQKFYGSRKSNWRSTMSYNNGANGFQNGPSLLNSYQTSSVNWHIYSTILSAINQLLGNNQNGQFDSDNFSLPFVGRKQQFSMSRWDYQLQNRPRVWTNQYENKAPSFENTTQMQMYTSILSAVTQLNNSVIMQDCENYTACLNNVMLQMSFLNVFRKF